MSNITKILNQPVPKPHFWMMPCAAIWISKPVMTSKGETCRIGLNDKVSVKDNALCSDNGKFTHRVVFVKSNNSLIEITLQNLLTAKIICIYFNN